MPTYNKAFVLSSVKKTVLLLFGKSTDRILITTVTGLQKTKEIIVIHGVVSQTAQVMSLQNADLKAFTLAHQTITILNTSPGHQGNMQNGILIMTM